MQRGVLAVKTIRSKVIFLFSLCVFFVVTMASLSYQNTRYLEAKLMIIESFDDLLDDILELRRYEKNLIFYQDAVSLEQCSRYLLLVDASFQQIAPDIIAVAGDLKYSKFKEDLDAYKKLLHRYMSIVRKGEQLPSLLMIRESGKKLVTFSEDLIDIKRERIKVRLHHYVIYFTVLLLFFFSLFAYIFKLISSSILRPLKVVEEATKKVASEEFVPVSSRPDRHDEISRLINAFNKMVEELKNRENQLLQSRKMASIGTLTSGIAHELNNPINNISLIVESLAEEDQDLSIEERSHLYQDLMDQAERTSDIVKKLLEFSRNRYAKTEKVALDDIIRKTADLVTNEMRLNRVKYSQAIEGGPLPELRVDKGGIQQVFLNLFLNSIQAMENGGRIDVVISRYPTTREIRIDVRDTGSGIPAGHLDRLFDPFFSTKKEGEGTGLGLSVSYNIINKHSGRIEVESTPGAGSCFSIFLPIGKDVDAN
jgi:two-component system, NtrC family, sensor kinase